MPKCHYQMSPSAMKDFIYKLKFFCRDTEVLNIIETENGEKAVYINYIEVSEDGKTGRIIQTLYDEVMKQPTFLEKLIYENDFIPVYHNDAYQRMIQEKCVHESGEGLLSFNGVYFKLIEYFDHIFADMAKEFGAIEHSYPTLIEDKQLNQCGYLDSFPQYINFVNHLNEDLDVIHQFLNNHDEKHYNQETHVLTPAICLHCYINNQNSTMKQSIVTAKGKCFRYESKNMEHPHRLHEFTMREIIFVGEESFTVRKRKETMDYIIAYIERIKLRVKIESASDPFFVGDNKAKTFQAIAKLKYEIRADIPSLKKDIAIGSFNIHGNHFGKSYNITQEDLKYVYTGCTAFGIERWAYAFLSQYGLEIDLWPDEIRKYIEGDK